MIMKKSYVLLVVLAITCVVYAPILQGDFVNWDDPVHVLNNLAVRSLSLEGLKEMFQQTVNGIYIPLTTLSFAVEYSFAGYNAFIYHLDNLLLHLGIVVFVFLLSRQLGLSAVGAGIAAGIFAIHPLHVESVAWVTERKDVLYAFFYLWALWSYSQRRLMATVVFGVLSMLAKPMALSLPLVLFLYDIFQRRKINRKAVLEKLPLAGLSVAIAWVTYASHVRVPGENGLGEGILIWIWTLIFYLRQFIFPAALVPLYQLPELISLFNPQYGFSVLTFLALILIVWRFRHEKWVLWGFGYYFCSIFFLLRLDNTADTNIVADRFMYLPSLGFCQMIGYLGQRVLADKRYAQAATVCIVSLGAFLFIKTFGQVKIWKDSVSLWEHELKVYPNQHIALNNLATAYRDLETYAQAERQYRFGDQQAAGRVAEVEAMYKKAIAVDGKYVEAVYNLAKLYQDIGKNEEAIFVYNQTLRLNPDYKDTYLNLGQIYRQSGQAQSAVEAYRRVLIGPAMTEDDYLSLIKEYNRAVEAYGQKSIFVEERQKAFGAFMDFIKSSSSPARSYFNLGFLYQDMGDAAGAVSAYRMVLDFNPKHAGAMYNLGNMYLKKGELKAALDWYKKALVVNPKNEDTYLNIGIVYQRLGNRDLAEENFRRVAEVNPKNGRGFFNLGFIYEQAGEAKRAIEFYEKAIFVDPKAAEPYYNLGNVYAALAENARAIDQYKSAVGIKPDHLDALVNLSSLSYRQNEFKDALMYLDRARALGYEPPAEYAKALEAYR